MGYFSILGAIPGFFLSSLFFIRLHPCEVLNREDHFFSLYGGYGLSLLGTSRLNYEDNRGQESTPLWQVLRPTVRFGLERPLSARYSLLLYWERSYQQGHGLESFDNYLHLDGARLGHRFGVILLKYFDI